MMVGAALLALGWALQGVLAEGERELLYLMK